MSGEVVEVIENYSGAESLEFALTSLPRWVRGNVPMGAVTLRLSVLHLAAMPKRMISPDRFSLAARRDDYAMLMRAPMIAPLILGLVSSPSVAAMPSAHPMVRASNVALFIRRKDRRHRLRVDRREAIDCTNCELVHKERDP